MALAAQTASYAQILGPLVSFVSAHETDLNGRLMSTYILFLRGFILCTRGDNNAGRVAAEDREMWNALSAAAGPLEEEDLSLRRRATIKTGLTERFKALRAGFTAHLEAWAASQTIQAQNIVAKMVLVCNHAKSVTLLKEPLLINICQGKMGRTQTFEST